MQYLALLVGRIVAIVALSLAVFVSHCCELVLICGVEGVKVKLSEISG